MNDMKNLHKYYYKDYFDKVDFSVLYKKEELYSKKEELSKLKGQKKSDKDKIDKLDKEINKLDEEINKIESKNETKITGQNGQFTASEYKESILKDANSIFYGNRIIHCEVLYPGLVTGVGIDHETKAKGEFKLGMHFDWTHGLPVVYGSSVKGVLRSAFIAEVNEKGKITKYEDYYLKKLSNTGLDWHQKEIEALFNDIFRGENYKGNNKSIYERDIFFDSVIVKTDSKGRILCSDSITPHGDDPLKNPTPLTFLKIAPGCTLEFRFKLHPSTIPVYDQEGNLVTENGEQKTEEFGVDKKIELFKEILTTVGVGAKTNVGYGQLKELSDK